MSKKENGQTSFATPEDLKKSEDFKEDLEKTRKRLLGDANAPLFTKMDKMIELMKERNELVKKNTEALTALITTLVGQVRDGKTPQNKEVVFPNQIEKSYETKEDEKKEVPLPPPAPEVSKTEEGYLVLAHNSFPENLASLLTFEDKGDHIKVKPRQWLGSDNFAKVARIVREMGGEYISAGKESHFKLYKKKE